MKIKTIAAAICILSSSCAPVYIPNAVNSPLFGEQGEMHINAQAGTNGLDLQTAYAVAPHFALMLNGSYMNESSDDPEFSDYHKHLFGEAGLGFYTALRGAGRFEIYGGLGMGEAISYDEYLFFEIPQALRARGQYHRAFLQTGIGASTDIFDGGFVVRAAYVRFNHFTADYLDDTLQKDVTEDNFYFEPVLYARIGWKWIKFQIQGGLSFPMTEESVLEHQPFLINMGLAFHFQTFK